MENQEKPIHSQLLPGTKQTGFLSLELVHSPWPGSFSAQYLELEQIKFQGCYAMDETIPQSVPSEKIQKRNLLCPTKSLPKKSQQQHLLQQRIPTLFWWDPALPLNASAAEEEIGSGSAHPNLNFICNYWDKMEMHWLGCLPLPNSHSAMTSANLCVSLLRTRALGR